MFVATIVAGILLAGCGTSDAGNVSVSTSVAATPESVDSAASTSEAAAVETEAASVSQEGVGEEPETTFRLHFEDENGYQAIVAGSIYSPQIFQAQEQGPAECSFARPGEVGGIDKIPLPENSYFKAIPVELTIEPVEVNGFTSTGTRMSVTTELSMDYTCGGPTYARQGIHGDPSLPIGETASYVFVDVSFVTPNEPDPVFEQRELKISAFPNASLLNPEDCEAIGGSLSGGGDRCIILLP